MTITMDPVFQPTGTLPRAAGLQALEQAAHSAQSGKQSLAVLTLDLDHFKNWSDQVGAEQAHAALDQVAALLRKGAPTGASLSHLGGDEFMLVLPGADISAAQAIAEDLREAIAVGLAGLNAQPPLTATVGVAASPADATWSASTLLSLADARMTFAKKRLTPHHNLAWAGTLPSDWYARLDIDATRWPQA